MVDLVFHHIKTRFHSPSPIFSAIPEGQSTARRLLSITEADDFLLMGPYREAQTLEVETVVKDLVYM